MPLQIVTSNQTKTISRSYIFILFHHSEQHDEYPSEEKNYCFWLREIYLHTKKLPERPKVILAASAQEEEERG